MRYAHVTERPAEAGSRLAAIVDGMAVSLSGVVDASSLDDLIASGPEAWERAETGAVAASTPIGQSVEHLTFLSPLLRPSKIVCIGLNYHDHAVEQGVELPQRPLVFAKFPSTLVGQDAVVSWSSEITQNVDWEAELAVIIGAQMREVDPSQALTGVFGYTCANDLSARDVQFADGQWVRGKSLDGFLPLGPVVVTADEFGSPDGHLIRCRRNGEVMQDSNTSQLIFSVGEVLSFLSQSFTLEPGDIVLTGTPAGVGAFRDPPIWLAPGDDVEVEIEGIGMLRTAIGRR
jgi:2-keto-4-pentenoate hydratase/2-oxohepta-3-ene-1,7-dioic acid hydratase in catechol pathway